MKYKKRLKRLQGRIEDWQRTVNASKANVAGYKKPGSLNK